MCQVLDRGVLRAFKTSLTSLKAYKSFKNRPEWRREMMAHSVTAMRVATSISTVLGAWEESGCWPIDPTKVLNLKNFPNLGYTEPLVEPPAKKKRGFNISNRRLTAQAALVEMRSQGN